ncbi:dTDP-4-amino-4,6-dideoxygalactose transaminase [Arthrobacter sp. SLBN-83]|uniref:DegT/DnrJ/EryC1/StrS family aminotransferase n=1 Tax=Arthrobacter sp. SLBN-83 TaxID=2768449 RepID=UPI0011515E1C|nr:DegT/DnrJ/EryC1/StrS family aminotransferase [Arthrobacter sp. SLBN-83]TQJ59043.1 dTDP-4-amino-4,6-dideoxygalactose transaminase [Arthrobacter sp. SLBN-83]
MTQPGVPLVDLTYQQAQIKEFVSKGFDRIISNSSFILGEDVKEFEAAWATYCGVRFAAGVGNGTDAIELALRAGHVGPGDEVIVPTNTFVATAGAVLRTGADLVLADCDEDFLLTPEAVADKVTKRTKAVIAVHLFGQAAPVGAIREVIPPNAILVEDMAQAQGALRNGAKVGSLGTVAATSFYPGKNLGCYGDAGAVMTDSEDIHTQIRRLRNHGGVERYEHQQVGFNSRMDSLQAVVLNAKLGYLDEWNLERRRAAEMYDDLLSDLEEVILPRIVSTNEHVFHLYVIRVPERDRIIGDLNNQGIKAGIHYPSPIHQLPAFRSMLGARGPFPVAEMLSRQIMSLPIYPGITPAQQELVAALLRKTLMN